jgi:hypothetical protein
VDSYPRVLDWVPNDLGNLYGGIAAKFLRTQIVHWRLRDDGTGKNMILGISGWDPESQDPGNWQ